MITQRFLILTMAISSTGCARQSCLPWQGHPKSSQVKTEEAYRHMTLGISLSEQGNYAEAEKEFRKAIEMNPDLPEPHYNLGRLLFKQDRYEEAENALRESIKIDPEKADAHVILGLIFALRGRDSEAEQEFREVIRLSPDDPMAYEMLANILGCEGRHGEAAEMLEKASALYEKQGKKKEAEKARELALLLHTSLLWSEIHSDSISQQKKEEAEKGLQAFIELYPHYAEAHLILASFLLGEGKLERAEKEYQEAFRLKPVLREAPEVRINIAFLLIHKGECAEAEREIREAIRIKPDLAEAYSALGICFSVQQRYEEAKVEFKKAIELFEKQGNYENARIIKELLEAMERCESLQE